MSDPLTRAGLRAEAIATRGDRQPRETAHDRLWTAVWALVGVGLLTIAAVLGSTYYDEDHDNQREDARIRRALDILVVSCAVLQDRDVDPLPAPCQADDVQEALHELAP